MIGLAVVNLWRPGAGLHIDLATLAAVPAVPIESLAMIVGIDRFMSECRAITNLIGNGVATVVISRWEREVTPAQLAAGLRRPASIVDLTPGTAASNFGGPGARSR